MPPPNCGVAWREPGWAMWLGAGSASLLGCGAPAVKVLHCRRATSWCTLSKAAALGACAPIAPGRLRGALRTGLRHLAASMMRQLQAAGAWAKPRNPQGCKLQARRTAPRQQQRLHKLAARPAASPTPTPPPHSNSNSSWQASAGYKVWDEFSDEFTFEVRPRRMGAASRVAF